MAISCQLVAVWLLLQEFFFGSCSRLMGQLVLTTVADWHWINSPNRLLLDEISNHGWNPPKKICWKLIKFSNFCHSRCCHLHHCHRHYIIKALSQLLGVGFLSFCFCSTLFEAKFFTSTIYRASHPSLLHSWCLFISQF